LDLWKEFQSSKEFDLNQYNIDKLFD